MLCIVGEIAFCYMADFCIFLLILQCAGQAALYSVLIAFYSANLGVELLACFLVLAQELHTLFFAVKCINWPLPSMQAAGFLNSPFSVLRGSL